MTSVTTGKLIIHNIPGKAEREQVIDYLCTFSKGSTREAISAKLLTLPLILGNSISEDTGKKIQVSLQNLGAEVTFTPNKTASDSPENKMTAQSGQQHSARNQENPDSGSNTASTKFSPELAKSSSNNDIKALVILLLVLVAGLCVTTAFSLPFLKAASDPDLILNRQLLKQADLNNKTCPRAINSQLRLDNYVAGNKKMTINYTLLEIESNDVNGFDLRSSVSRNIRQGVCKEQNTADLLKKDVVFEFAVHGKDGKQIFEYQVAKEDCEE